MSPSPIPSTSFISFTSLTSSMESPATIPSSPITPPDLSHSSPPDEMYTMPLLPPLSPLPPEYIYPSPHGDLLTTYSEGFCNDDYRTWDGELLSWASGYEDVIIEDSFLEGGERAEEGAHSGDLAVEATAIREGGGRELPPPPSDLDHQEQVGWLEMEMQQWSGMAKAARSKRRIARQMSNCGVPRFVLPRRTTSSISSPSSSSASIPRKSSRRNLRGMSTVTKSSPADCAVNIFPPIHMGLRYVLHKELKNSDVTSLGRIVLPKRESETYLPFLAVKEGIQITVRDMFSPDAWRMRYRFWPNNKSRMYVLENTGDYIKKNGLSCGDVVALYQDEYKQLYVCARKTEKHQYVMEVDKDGQDTLLKDDLLEGSRSKLQCADGNFGPR